MKDVKDNFSEHASAYAKYRPGYPPELYTFLLGLVKERNIAWDCATGNGQVAVELSNHFDKVYATDISEAQLKNAHVKDNIFYSIARAESTEFPDDFFDMITVAQAIHWFDFHAFYTEANRTMKPGGILAVMGYGLLKTGEDTDAIIGHFYKNIIGPYWDKERKYVDENLTTIPFPFEEIATPILINRFEWSLDDLLGYFSTWSAVQHYIKANNEDPVAIIRKSLEEKWPAGSTRMITFPVLLRVARIKK